MKARLAILLALAAVAHAARTAEIYFIDVEGGQATLIAGPSGQNLLIDTGYAGYGGRDADRIAAAAKNAGVKHIDYLLITHFHSDHVGGLANLLQRLSVGTILDIGSSVDAGGKYPDEYSELVKKIEASKGEHKVIAAGDKIPVKGLDVTVVIANGKPIEAKGEPNQSCAGIQPRKEGEGDETGENPQAAGVVIEFGKFRFADLSDITWNKELALLCPENRVGKVDLYLTTHHGGESSKAIWGMAPRVAIMNNGARKGGDPKGWKVVMGSPGIEDLWQLHFSIAGGGEANARDSFIANVDENGPGDYLKVTASDNGAFTVFNQRNKFSKSYPAK
jgi:beta-lactamase superfamily II metal-dependent hydrolase